MKTLNILLACIFFIFISSISLQAQRTKKWTKFNDQGKYFIEGNYSQDVSSSKDLALISFYKNIPKKKIVEGDENFYFTFHSPKIDSFFLRVQECYAKKYFRLESKPDLSVAKGCNIIGPWKGKHIKKLYERKANIGSSKLGYLLRLGPVKSPYILPVSFQEENDSIVLDQRISFNYQAVFRFSKEFLNGHFSVYKGEHNNYTPDDPSIICIDKEPLENYTQKLRLMIPSESIEDYEGWLTLKIHVEFTDASSETSYLFFYHQLPNKG